MILNYLSTIFQKKVENHAQEAMLNFGEISYTKGKKKVIGLHSGHDCSLCILEEGVPILHIELERFLRKKEPRGDSFFLFQKLSYQRRCATFNDNFIARRR